MELYIDQWEKVELRDLMGDGKLKTSLIISAYPVTAVDDPLSKSGMKFTVDPENGINLGINIKGNVISHIALVDALRDVADTIERKYRERTETVKG